MKIITLPHPSLRQTAKPVTSVSAELSDFAKQLRGTLAKTKNPKGVGLAAPQVNRLWRVFATALGEEDVDRLYINPQIIDHSDKLELGAKKDDVRLEGCLSIPKIYGPVPRWSDILLEYDVIEGQELRRKTASFQHFAARVIQHELDHLNGVLFIDYSLEYSLPLYREDAKGELIEVPAEFVQTLVTKSHSKVK